MNIYAILNKKHGDPIIQTLPESIFMIGVSVRTNEKKIFKDSQVLGQQYARIKKEGIVPNKIVPRVFVAISRNFKEDGSWEYLMGDVVTTLDSIPEGLTGCEIPAGLYARFSLQPRFTPLWGIALGMEKKYIFSEWLPASNYEINSEAVGDFEYHDERAFSKKPEIDLFIPLRSKA